MGSEIVTEDAPGVQRVLEKKALRASFWSILEYGSGMGLRVVSSLVLTRLLAPAYFGEMTLLTTLIVGINLLSDIGLAPSVIQSPHGDEPDFLNTAWTIQIIRGVVLMVAALVLSWPMSRYYRDSHLTVLLPVLALSTLIGSFNSTNLLSLARHLGVRRLFFIDGSMAVVSLIVTIIWAYYWPSVWAIIAGQVISTIYRLILSHIPAIAPGIKNSFRWDKNSVHNIVHFGKWIMIGTAFFFFASQADRLILARLVPFAVLGIYGLAYSLSDIPRAIILALSNRVAYPFVSKMVHMPMPEFRAKFLHYRFFILLVGAGLLSIMVTWGHLIITHLYDKRYQDAAWMIPILALGLWHTLLYQTTAPVLFSLGKPRYNAAGNAAYCVAMLVGLPLAFHFWGLFGAVIAIAAGDLPLYLVIQTGTTREGVRPLRQDLQMTAIFLAILGGCMFLRYKL
ncbi:MAG: oligosaccharide flippase family protein [Edaphobacter sp.]|uniref:oligosaccharide flippase family protein n=1 Tax=Edaphobacter sp. TaxID=1934404 RepID=UPI00238F4B51|nr:oligosaccharide flippase family protein [Edaphobacter sp.]MDE1175173.1 oligosaccharide flippase family protein [Edaphobacter sp.]